MLSDRSRMIARNSPRPNIPLLLSPVFKLALLFLWGLLLAGCQPAGEVDSSQAGARPAPAAAPVPILQPGDGTDVLDRVLETGVIRVGVRVWPEAQFSPPAFRGFSNARNGGALNGFEIDLARELAETLGLELELVEAYPPIIASGGWGGQWDIAIASLVPFDQPLPWVDPAAGSPLSFSRPYAYMPMGLLVPAAGNTWQNLEQFSGRQVGVLEHSAYQYLLTPEGRSFTVKGEPVLAELPADVQPVVVSNLVKAVHELAEGGQPAVLFGPAPVFEEAVKSDLPVEFAPGSERLGVQPLAVAVVPREGLKVDRLLAAINEVLDVLDRQGILAETSFRWYGQDLSKMPD